MALTSDVAYSTVTALLLARLRVTANSIAPSPSAAVPPATARVGASSSMIFTSTGAAGTPS